MICICISTISLASWKNTLIVRFLVRCNKISYQAFPAKFSPTLWAAPFPLVCPYCHPFFFRYIKRISLKRVIGDIQRPFEALPPMTARHCSTTSYTITMCYFCLFITTVQRIKACAAIPSLCFCLFCCTLPFS